MTGMKSVNNAQRLFHVLQTVERIHREVNYRLVWGTVRNDLEKLEKTIQPVN